MMNDVVNKAKTIRTKVEELATSLDDSSAVEYPDLFPLWDGGGINYIAGDRLRYAGVLYKVIQSHTSQSDWTPDIAHSLFAEVLIPDPEKIPVWVQPDSTNPYMKGDKVHYPGENDPVYESVIDNNVWAPDVYGWEQLMDNN